MNEMRKLMEAVEEANKDTIEIGDEYVHIKSKTLVTVYDILRGGAYIEVTTPNGPRYTYTPQELQVKFTKITTESKELTETSSEQYEVMLDMAGELGDKIAADNILDDHTNAWSQGLERLSPEEITVNVDKHIATASRRMADKAHTYIERSFRKGA